MYDKTFPCITHNKQLNLSWITKKNKKFKYFEVKSSHPFAFDTKRFDCIFLYML